MYNFCCVPQSQFQLMHCCVRVASTKVIVLDVVMDVKLFLKKIQTTGHMPMKVPKYHMRRLFLIVCLI